MKEIKFCPELQQSWILEEICLVRCDRALVRVSWSNRHDSPGVVGRHGSDIMSYPQVSSVLCEAEFTFTQCLMVRVWDEFAISTIEKSKEDAFEGSTFRRFTKSALLSAHSQMPAPVYHYELVCDSIIDVLCTKSPTVILRPSASSAINSK
jgi:hypothetical protein